MWGYFGDALDGPPGTYYDSRSEPVTYFWNIFEQVLIRPTLLDAFVPASLKILDSDGDETLLTKLQHSFDRLDTVAEFRLLGRVPFEAAAALQERLVYEAGGLPEPHWNVVYRQFGWSTRKSRLAWRQANLNPM
jgi:hypothetical protein